LLETRENGNPAADFIGALNKNSLEVIDNAWVEPSVKLQAAGKHYQFLRTGYFVIDTDTTPDKLVFNRVVGLRDSWAKEKNK
jgi:glutaminyl-tRNA synthetase